MGWFIHDRGICGKHLQEIHSYMHVYVQSYTHAFIQQTVCTSSEAWYGEESAMISGSTKSKIISNTFYANKAP